MSVTKLAFVKIEGLYKTCNHLGQTILDFRKFQLVPQNKYSTTLRVWDTNLIVGLNGTIGYNEWHLRWFQHKLLKQLDILHAINQAPHGILHKRRRFMELHPLHTRAEELDRKYVYLYDNMFILPNAKTFLMFHLLRELELLHNGNLHNAINNQPWTLLHSKTHLTFLLANTFSIS